ncbi:hypothetical protein N2152v2_009898 [Parachlorella kessleri]
MVTDRVGTTCLLAILCILYPSFHIIFLVLLMVDIFSHWFQMYSTLAAGSITHKDVHSRSFIVRFYYQHRLFMGFCCICCEVLYLCLYLLHWQQYRTWVPIHLAEVAQQAAKGYLPSGGIPLVGLLAAFCVPGTLIKQFINLVQMKTAMAVLVALDRKRDQQAKSS